MNIRIPTDREVRAAVRELPSTESLLRKLYPDAFINNNGGDAMGEDLIIVVVIEGGMVSAVCTNNSDPEVRVIVVDYDETDPEIAVVVQDDPCSVWEGALVQSEDFVSAVMEVL